VELPSASELSEASELLVDLGEVDFEELSFPEVLDLYRAFCTHPVVSFARRLCDLLEVGVE